MRKKVVMLSLALMLTLGLAAGCAPPGEDNNDPLNTDPVLNDGGNNGGNDGNDMIE